MNTTRDQYYSVHDLINATGLSFTTLHRIVGHIPLEEIKMERRHTRGSASKTFTKSSFVRAWHSSARGHNHQYDTITRVESWIGEGKIVEELHRERRIKALEQDLHFYKSGYNVMKPDYLKSRNRWYRRLHRRIRRAFGLQA